MELYLSIVMTYLSISITGFLITVYLEKDTANKIYEKRKKENDTWKDSVTELIKIQGLKQAEYVKREVTKELIFYNNKGNK